MKKQMDKLTQDIFSLPSFYLEELADYVQFLKQQAKKNSVLYPTGGKRFNCSSAGRVKEKGSTLIGDYSEGSIPISASVRVAQG